MYAVYLEQRSLTFEKNHYFQEKKHIWPSFNQLVFHYILQIFNFCFQGIHSRTFTMHAMKRVSIQNQKQDTKFIHLTSQIEQLQLNLLMWSVQQGPKHRQIKTASTCSIVTPPSWSIVTAVTIFQNG